MDIGCQSLGMAFNYVLSFISLCPFVVGFTRCILVELGFQIIFCWIDYLIISCITIDYANFQLTRNHRAISNFQLTRNCRVILIHCKFGVSSIRPSS